MPHQGDENKKLKKTYRKGSLVTEGLGRSGDRKDNIGRLLKKTNHSYSVNYKKEKTPTSGGVTKKKHKGQ